MGRLAPAKESKGGRLSWDYELDDESKVVNEDGSISSKDSSRIEKTVVYRVNTLPFHVCFQFMFDENGNLIGRHLYDYD